MIRTLLCLAVSFGVGALAFSGEGEEDELRARVRALTLTLQRRADADRGPRLVSRFHDIAKRAGPIGAGRRPQLDLIYSNQVPKEGVGNSEPRFGLGFDEAVELMLRTIEPGSWESMEGVEVGQVGTGVLVRHLPRVQDKIDRLFKDLARQQARELQVEIRAHTLGERDLLLTDAQVEALAKTDALAAIEFRCESGVRARRTVGSEFSYLAEFGIKLAEAASIGKPARARVLDGFSIDVRTLLDDAADGVRLELELDRNELQRPPRRADTEHGPLELPRLAVTRLRTGFWTNLGKWTIAGGSPECLLLVRVDRLPPP
ncbi:MAG: hypothetical protein ACYTEG_02205 [Planctomycetota bacterium]|jgi:hypothetical protein